MNATCILNDELFITINHLEIKLLRSLTASSVFDGAVGQVCFATTLLLNRVLHSYAHLKSWRWALWGRSLCWNRRCWWWETSAERSQPGRQRSPRHPPSTCRVLPASVHDKQYNIYTIFDEYDVTSEHIFELLYMKCISIRLINVVCITV